MSLTIANWIIIGFIVIIGLVVAGVLYYDDFNSHPKGAIITIVITIIFACAVGFLFNWYHTSTASGIRNYKDFTSEMANGINREITITAEDGREIFHYEGKIDLDMQDENYLRFETQDGKRYNIEYGIQDTVIVVEK